MFHASVHNENSIFCKRMLIFLHETQQSWNHLSSMETLHWYFTMEIEAIRTGHRIPLHQFIIVSKWIAWQMSAFQWINYESRISVCECFTVEKMNSPEIFNKRTITRALHKLGNWRMECVFRFPLQQTSAFVGISFSLWHLMLQKFNNRDEQVGVTMFWVTWNPLSKQSEKAPAQWGKSHCLNCLCCCVVIIVLFSCSMNPEGKDALSHAFALMVSSW